MSRTTTRRPGRLRALAVVSALAVSMIAGTAAPSFAEVEQTGPSDKAAGPAADGPAASAPGAPWNNAFGPAGWSWF